MIESEKSEPTHAHGEIGESTKASCDLCEALKAAFEAGRLAERADVDAYLSVEFENHLMWYTQAFMRGVTGEYHSSRMEVTQKIRKNIQDLRHFGAYKKAVTG